MTWSPLARGYALAWMRNKAETCPRCGTRHDEWDPKTGGDRDAYVGETFYCRGDDVLAMAQDNLPKGADGRTLPGFVAYLQPRAVAEAKRQTTATPD